MEADYDVNQINIKWLFVYFNLHVKGHRMNMIDDSMSILLYFPVLSYSYHPNPSPLSILIVTLAVLGFKPALEFDKVISRLHLDKPVCCPVLWVISKRGRNCSWKYSDTYFRFNRPEKDDKERNEV